jgi:hypothetical protein
MGCLKVSAVCLVCVDRSQQGTVSYQSPPGFEEFELVNDSWIGPGSSGRIS